jgi:hypothetical protein
MDKGSSDYSYCKEQLESAYYRINSNQGIKLYLAMHDLKQAKEKEKQAKLQNARKNLKNIRE